MLKKQDAIALAIDGTISEVQAGKITLCLSHMDDIKSYIAQIEATAMQLAGSYTGALKIIQSVPGISQLSALAIFSEIGADMSTFHSAKHLCSWAGLAPSNDQSAGKKKSVRISRAGVYIKPLLVQCANAALRDKKFPHYRTRYEAIKHRRGHKRAIIAIARMMLTAIYHMLSTGEMFNPALYEKSQCKPGFVASSEEHAVKLLQRLGYSVVKTPESA